MKKGVNGVPKMIRERYELQNMIKTSKKQMMANIRIICNKRKLSLTKLAELAGIKKGTWNNRKNRPEDFSFEELLKIAYYLETKPESMIFGKWDINDTTAI